MRFFSPTLVLSTGFLFFTIPNLASARDSLSGSWEEEYSETIVSVEQWSPACGPTPKSTGRRKRGLEFKLDDQGIALKFVGSKLSFSTADCQTTNKAVQPKERTVKKKLFMISCSTTEDANPYENGLYSFRIKSPERIDYRETTRFSRNASGSMCVHTMRIRRVYKKIAGAVDGNKVSEKDEADSKTSPDSSKPVPPAKHDPCQNPGAIVSVFIEPSHLELAPGAKSCIEISASDSNACPVKTSLGWDKGNKPKGVSLEGGKCIAVSRKAPSGKHKLHLQAAGVGVILSLTVVKTHGSLVSKQDKQEPDQVVKTDTAQIVDAGMPDAQAADSDHGHDKQQNGDIPAKKEEKDTKTNLQDFSSASSDDTKPAQDLPSWLVPSAVAGGAILIIFLALVIIFRKRSRGQASPTQEPSPTEIPSPAHKEPQEPPKPKLVMAPTRVEPLRAVPSEQKQQVPSDPPSPVDPSPVDPQNPQLEPAHKEPPSPTKFCIGCGKQLPVEAKFCPYCAQKQD